VPVCLRPVVVGHSPHPDLEVAVAALRPVVQNRGVELAPGQLSRVGAVGAAEVGQHGPGMDRPELEVRRHPRGVVEVRPVPVVRVGLEVMLAEACPGLPRRLLAGIRELGIGGRVVRDLHAVEDVPVRPRGLRVGGLRPAVLEPGSVEGGEDPVGAAVVLEHPAGRDGIRRSARDQWCVAEGGGDAPVAGCAVRRGVGADVHGARADLPHEPGNHLLGLATEHRETPAVPAQVGVECPQRPQQVCRARTTAGAQEHVVEHEQGRDRSLLCRGGQRRVVAETQVTPEPEDRRGRVRHDPVPRGSPCGTTEAGNEA